MNPAYSTGITGQSSGRGMWVTPKVYQTTMSRLDDGPVRRGPLREPVPAGVLVGVVAGGPPLVGRVGGDPEIAGGEAGPLGHARVRVGEQRGRRPGHELVARRGSPRRFFERGLTIFQHRLADGVHDATGAVLGLEQRGHRSEGVGPRVVRARGRPDRVSTSYTEFAGPSTSVSSRMLNRCWWNGAASWGATMEAKRRLLARRHPHGRQDAGELHLELDRPVQVEVPEEAVVVVARRWRSSSPPAGATGAPRCDPTRGSLCFQRIP